MKVYKASPTGSEQIPSQVIEITEPFPCQDYAGPSNSGFLMEDDAERIFEALLSLPQGTLDRLTVLLMKRAVTQLIVRTE